MIMTQTCKRKPVPVRVEYRWRSGARRPVDLAVILGKEVERLRKKHRVRGITAEILVKEAASPRSPLHELFDWEDDSAAHQWRLEQARSAMRDLVVVSVTHQGEVVDDRPVRALFNLDRVPDGDDDTAGEYIATATVLESQVLRRRLLRQALRELEGFRAKYKFLSELNAIFVAIDKANGKYNK
jgi:hypothetical protein